MRFHRLGLIALLLAGCGGGDRPSTSPGTATASSSSASPSGSASSAPSASASVASAPPKRRSNFGRPYEIGHGSAEKGIENTDYSSGGASTSGACAEQRCNGSASPALQSFLDDAAKRTRPCYEKMHREDPAIAGVIEMSVRVAADGTVCERRMTMDQSARTTLSSCVQSQFDSITKAPAPQGGCAVVPVRFSKKQIMP